MAKIKDYRKGYRVPGKRGPRTGTTYLSTSDPTRRAIWLRTFRETGGSYSAACAASAPHLSGDSKNPPGYSSWRALEARDPEWAAQVAEVRQQICDDLEAEMWRRSVQGVEVPQYQKAMRIREPVTDEKGQPVRDEEGNVITKPASIRKYSDALLLARARALMPDKYADRKTVDINHNTVRGAWQVGTEDLSALSPAQKEQLTQILMTIRDHRASLNRAAGRIEDHTSREVSVVEVEAVEDVQDDTEEFCEFDLGPGESDV